MGFGNNKRVEYAHCMVEYLSWIIRGGDVACNLFVLWCVLVCIILIGVEAECLTIEQLHIMNIKSTLVGSPKKCE